MLTSEKDIISLEVVNKVPIMVLKFYLSNKKLV